MPIRTKIIPSIEKCFLDESILSKPQLSEISMLRNERLSFQFAYIYDDVNLGHKQHSSLVVESPIADYIKIALIESVPVALPAYPHAFDDNYLRTTPGLYPDLLIPFDTKLPLVLVYNQLRSLLITIENTDGIEPGEYPVNISVVLGENKVTSTINVKVVDAMLPEQELIHTQWFHNDCIATYYNCDIFSERHWELIGNYMEAAHNCGVNMILTPVLTPPLDTAVGHERPTVQLVDIDVVDGTYKFGYDKLDRYVKLALDSGMKYFEISHFFSQWGAIHAPKVMATVDGEYKRIFGWDTDSTGEEYKTFIRAFVSSLVDHLKLLGVDKQCWFHISDEPGLDQLESYKAAKALVADLLDGYKLMDALSSYEFYETGACDIPVPCNNHVAKFIENNVPNLWTYYCCSQNKEVSNRFLAMPGQRTRILGEQLYKFDIKGFLQWGFNFWYSQGSLHPINPFTDTCGDYFVPAGDAYSVYPGQDGKALYSLHAVHFYEALQDQRALKLLEAKIGREKVLELIEENCTEPMTFSKYPHSREYLLALREKVNSLL
ncbi:MAG: DUF4091 domain-containing protein [Clostridiales bacterium]|nr:DUF4091 domain-containing protein [Clostridiales bacterium]